MHVSMCSYISKSRKNFHFPDIRWLEAYHGTYCWWRTLWLGLEQGLGVVSLFFQLKNAAHVHCNFNLMHHLPVSTLCCLCSFLSLFVSEMEYSSSRFSVSQSKEFSQVFLRTYLIVFVTCIINMQLMSSCKFVVHFFEDDLFVSFMLFWFVVFIWSSK